MTAKEYLSGLRLLNIKIKHKLQEAEELRSLAFGTASLNSDSERVQTSPSGDGRQIILVNRYVDLEAEIQALVDKYVVMKDEIINRIHQLEDARYVEVLFKRYVEGKTMRQIAEEMDYEYTSIYKIRKRAIAELDKLGQWDM